MKVLVIAPHMDDEVLGVGGTICRHLEAGDRVKVLFLANRVYDHQLDEARLAREESNALDAKQVLGYQDVEFARLPDERLRDHFSDVLRVIETAVADFDPQRIYINHRGDPHQDHQSAFEAGWISLRSISGAHSGLEMVACYEVPSSTEQSPPLVECAFHPNFFVDIEDFLERKQKALACYVEEARAFPNPRSAEGVKVMASCRGMAANLRSAEAFQILRQRW